MRWRRANMLAPGFRVPQCGTHPLSRLHRPAHAGRLALGNCIQSQQRNCSRLSRDSSRRSTTATNKELPLAVAAGAWALKIYLAWLNIALQGRGAFQTAHCFRYSAVWTAPLLDEQGACARRLWI